jgi:hypothetical protein
LVVLPLTSDCFYLLNLWKSFFIWSTGSTSMVVVWSWLLTVVVSTFTSILNFRLVNFDLSVLSILVDSVVLMNFLAPQEVTSNIINPTARKVKIDLQYSLRLYFSYHVFVTLNNFSYFS